MNHTDFNKLKGGFVTLIHLKAVIILALLIPRRRRHTIPSWRILFPNLLVKIKVLDSAPCHVHRNTCPYAPRN